MLSLSSMWYHAPFIPPQFKIVLLCLSEKWFYELFFIGVDTFIFCRKLNLKHKLWKVLVKHMQSGRQWPLLGIGCFLRWDDILVRAGSKHCKCFWRKMFYKFTLCRLYYWKRSKMRMLKPLKKNAQLEYLTLKILPTVKCSFL